MIQKYKKVSIIYGGEGKKYAEILDSRINELACKERYPLCSSIIMESVMTRELLSDVIDLFKQSEFCVVFLTADDFVSTSQEKKKRLRQNVIFELGMALIQLGRERCILLSDFDMSSSDFELPSDMHSLEFKKFDPNKTDEVIRDVIIKILKLSNESILGGMATSDTPQYDNLLYRGKYYVDYENIFNIANVHIHKEGTSFLKGILAAWLNECSTLDYYDEKCIYLFERIVFLPIFGKIPEAQQWLFESGRQLSNYTEKDIDYYGDTKILDFVCSLIKNIVEYTNIKITNNNPNVSCYKKLLEAFLSEPIPFNTDINPLVAIVYYDYLGLTYMKLYNCTKDVCLVRKAQDSFEKAMDYVGRVDMSMKIWAGFINYNIARAIERNGNINESEKYYKTAIRIREGWIKCTNYNITVRNALSFEYFIARIDYLEMRRKNNLISEIDARKEYEDIENELDMYSDVEDKLEQLLFVRRLLKEKRA